MPRKEGKTGVRSWKDTQRIALQKKKNKSKKTKKTAAAATGGTRRNLPRSGPFNNGEMDNYGGMDAEDKQRLTALLAKDESGASDTGDSNSASEV
jgi:hypothetical protein